MSDLIKEESAKDKDTNSKNKKKKKKNVVKINGAWKRINTSRVDNNKHITEEKYNIIKGNKTILCKLHLNFCPEGNLKYSIQEDILPRSNFRTKKINKYSNNLAWR